MHPEAKLMQEHPRTQTQNRLVANVTGRAHNAYQPYQFVVACSNRLKIVVVQERNMAQ